MNNKEFIWGFLLSKGMTEHGAAGIMGHMGLDSSFNPLIVDKTILGRMKIDEDDYTRKTDLKEYNDFMYDSAYYGIGGWFFWGDKQCLLDLATKEGKSVGDLDLQCEWLWQSLSSSYGPLLSILRSTADIDIATSSVFSLYRKSSYFDNISLENYTACAKQIFKELESTVEVPKSFFDYKEMGNGYLYEYQPAEQSPYWTLPERRLSGIVLLSLDKKGRTAQEQARELNKNTEVISVHGFVDKNRYIEVAPTRIRKSFMKKCIYSRSYLDDSYIGIVLCDSLDTNFKEEYTEAIDIAAKVIADLCKYHEFLADRVILAPNNKIESSFARAGTTLDEFRKTIDNYIIGQLIDEGDEQIEEVVPKVEKKSSKVTSEKVTTEKEDRKKGVVIRQKVSSDGFAPLEKVSER